MTIFVCFRFSLQYELPNKELECVYFIVQSKTDTKMSGKTERLHSNHGKYRSLLFLASRDKYTHRQKLSNTTFFFGDTVLEVAERNMWVMEIKYFEFC